MLARQPLDKAIEQADEALKSQLILSKELRSFAVDELGLPDSNSYKAYVPLKREFPVWTVVAAPEFSLQPKQWCYPVIGCASYRGYFRESAANAYASKLRSKGLETEVGGAPAYSTLGWFADPLLPSMMRYGDAVFAETLFHEIAHQQLYINGDSDFNEAFATVVGEVGVIRWLEKNRPTALAGYEKRVRVKEQFYALVTQSKDELAVLYNSGASEPEMRAGKDKVLQDLVTRYKQLQENEWNGKAWYKNWFAETPSNAKFAALSTYLARVPELRSLLSACNQNLPRFYKVLSLSQIIDKKVVVPQECHDSNQS